MNIDFFKLAVPIIIIISIVRLVHAFLKNSKTVQKLLPQNTKLQHALSDGIQRTFINAGAVVEGNQLINTNHNYKVRIKTEDYNTNIGKNVVMYKRFAIQIQFKMPHSLPANWRIMSSSTGYQRIPFKTISGAPTPPVRLQFFANPSTRITAQNWMILSLFGDFDIINKCCGDSILNDVHIHAESWMGLGEFEWYDNALAFTFFGDGPSSKNHTSFVNHIITWSTTLATSLKAFDPIQFKNNEDLLVHKARYTELPKYEAFVFNALFNVMRVHESASETQLQNIEAYLHQHHETTSCAAFMPHLRRQYFERHTLAQLWKYAEIEMTDALEQTLLSHVNITDLIVRPSLSKKYRQRTYQTWLKDTSSTQHLELFSQTKPNDVSWMIIDIMNTSIEYPPNELNVTLTQHLAKLPKHGHLELVNELEKRAASEVLFDRQVQTILNCYSTYILAAPQLHIKQLGFTPTIVLMKRVPQLQSTEIWSALIEQISTNKHLEMFFKLSIELVASLDTLVVITLFQSKHHLEIQYNTTLREHSLTLLQRLFQTNQWIPHRKSLSMVILKVFSYDPQIWEALHTLMKNSFNTIFQALENQGIVIEDMNILNELIQDTPKSEMKTLYTTTQKRWMTQSKLASSGALTLDTTHDMAGGMTVIREQTQGQLTQTDE